MKEPEITTVLIHSYFDHILREVEPFLKFFNIEKILTDSTLCDDRRSGFNPALLERLFFMACLVSEDITLPFNYKIRPTLNFEKNLQKQDWLTEFEHFSIKSKQGSATKYLLFKKHKIVIKKAKNSKFDQITHRDFCVGIHLNKFLNTAPFFVRTLGCFEHKKQFYISTEFIDGINLKEFLRSKNGSFVDFLNIFFQILLGLEIAQNKLNFAHYDLHTDNVILTRTTSKLVVQLYGHEYIVNANFRPVMIDFGLSSIHTKGHNLGQKSLETKGIYSHLSPGYDIYVFLLFCLDMAKNISVIKGINDLLVFFNTKTNISMDLLTQNHIKSLNKGVSDLIPYQFIKFLLKKYPSDLAVSWYPKTTTECLGDKPISIQLQSVFNVDVIPGFSKFKKGFIKSLLNNIRTYYWYQKKIDLTSDEIKSLLKSDEYYLQNLVDDLNLVEDPLNPKVSIEQKSLYFYALDIYHIIVELELDTQYQYYSEWLEKFNQTFVHKKIFNNLETILYNERIFRAQLPEPVALPVARTQPRTQPLPVALRDLAGQRAPEVTQELSAQRI